MWEEVLPRLGREVAGEQGHGRKHLVEKASVGPSNEDEILENRIASFTKIIKIGRPHKESGEVQRGFTRTRELLPTTTL